MTGLGESGGLAATYDEARARFRAAGTAANVAVEAHSIAARGPEGEALTIDVASLGAERPHRALLVLSGVHGVEGFLGSALQCDLLGRLEPAGWPDDVAVVMVHTVNPWGMAWGRRQNESNVDLNRNWRRDDERPAHNDAYDEIHALACPDTPTLPAVDDLLAVTAALVAERGLAWVRDAITLGQYRHPDGLHFGGDRTEESNRILAQVVTRHLAGVERLLTVDLHTGHGPLGAVTLLSDVAPGAPQDRFLRAVAGDRAAVEATAGNPEATTGNKSGQIGNGIGRMLAPATCFASSVEFGSSADLEQLAATYQEHWVARHGDRDDPTHAAVVWAYRCCFTPEDPGWASEARLAGGDILDRALAAVVGWTDSDPQAGGGERSGDADSPPS